MRTYTEQELSHLSLEQLARDNHNEWQLLIQCGRGHKNIVNMFGDWGTIRNNFCQLQSDKQERYLDSLLYTYSKLFNLISQNNMFPGIVKFAQYHDHITQKNDVKSNILQSLSLLIHTYLMINYFWGLFYQEEPREGETDNTMETILSLEDAMRDVNVSIAQLTDLQNAISSIGAKKHLPKRTTKLELKNHDSNSIQDYFMRVRDKGYITYNDAEWDSFINADGKITVIAENQYQFIINFFKYLELENAIHQVKNWARRIIDSCNYSESGIMKDFDNKQLNKNTSNNTPIDDSYKELFDGIFHKK